MKKIAIIQFPGSNCERETRLACLRADMHPIDFFWNQPPEMLDDFDGYILIGGFSYEDRCRAGLLAALDPLMDHIAKQSERNKPILGICNGAQILIESGLIPGLSNRSVGMALTTNKRIRNSHIVGTGYYNEWVYVKPPFKNETNAFTRMLDPKQPLHIPVAHAQGRFILPEDLIQATQKHQMMILQYCDIEGKISKDFPINPNGSMENIAAICNPQGNVMAIMPHPERTPNGDCLFHSMRQFIEEKPILKRQDLHFKPRLPTFKVYQTTEKQKELLIDSIITDNTALSVTQTLQQLGIKATLTRQIHWEITAKHHIHEITKQAISSFELHNPNKEKIVTAPHDKRSFSLLIRDHDNIEGMRRKEILTEHFNLTEIDEIKKGDLWHIQTDHENEEKLKKLFQTKSILFNPYAHECYFYP